MERVIKFRGIRVDNGKWHYGDLARKIYDGTSSLLPIAIREVGYYPIEVHPESVGQFIGVKGYEGEYKDRHNNEVELFEGDIVEAMSEGSKGTFLIKYRTGSNPCWLLFPNWQGSQHWNIAASDLGRTTGDYYDDLKRIGNIYEHPHLLNK